MSHFIFVEKTMKKWRFCNYKFSKITKSLIFQWFFEKNENFDKFTSRWPEKKIFRDGLDDPKMVFETLLWNDAIKIWHCLIRFLHFWWFHFFDFLVPQKMRKIESSKNRNFAIFLNFCSNSSILFIFRYFSCFLLPKSLSSIKILILGFRF